MKLSPFVVVALVLLFVGGGATSTAATRNPASPPTPKPPPKLPPVKAAPIPKRTTPMVDTSDWTDADINPAFLAFCAAVGCDDISVPTRAWANESDNRTTAHNPNGNASGLFQLMPKTAKVMGYPIAGDPTLAAFRKLSVTEQLKWATRYYGAHKGQVSTVARFYLATFMPALLAHGDDMGFVLCGKNGPYAEDYGPNAASFDPSGKGTITPADLVAASERATGPRTLALIQRIADAAALATASTSGDNGSDDSDDTIA